MRDGRARSSSVTSAPTASACTAANRCSVVCSGPVSRILSSEVIPVSAVNGEKDDSQDSAVRTTGRGRPLVPEVTATSQLPAGHGARAASSAGASGSVTATGSPSRSAANTAARARATSRLSAIR